MKLMVHKKEKCVVCQLLERETDAVSFQHNGKYEAVPLDEIEDYYIEQTSKGFSLIIERGMAYKAFYFVDLYSSRKEAESAARILFL